MLHHPRHGYSFDARCWGRGRGEKLREKRDEKMKRMRGKDKKESEEQRRKRKGVRAPVCSFRGLKAEAGEN